LHYLRDLQGLRHDDRNADVAYSKFLDNHGRGQRICSEAAPFLVKRHGADTDLMGRLDDLPGKTFRGIFLGIKRRRARPDFSLNEALNGLKNHALIFGLDENILHGRLLYARCLDRDQEKLDEKVFSAGRVGSGDLGFTEPITANAVVFPLALCY
jgi:hypothetical protein